MKEETPVDIPKEAKNLQAQIEENNGPHVETSVLEKELDRYLNKYLMDLVSAGNAIAKDFGCKIDCYMPANPTENESCNISELVEGLTATVTGRVANIVKKTTKNGKQKQNITVYDRTGIMRLTYWNHNGIVEKNKIYRFKNCKMKCNQYDGLVASCGENNIEETTADIPESLKELPIINGKDKIVLNAQNLSVRGKVLNVEKIANPFKAKIAVDGTSFLFVSWNACDLRPNETVTIFDLSYKLNDYDGLHLETNDFTIIMR